jgi:hypothetical protein
MVDYFRSRLPVMKVLTRTASLLEMPYSELFKIWSVMSGAEEPADILKSFGKVGTYVEALLWNREHSGYDLLWGWSDRDRNAMEFVKLLERYRVSRAT